MADVNSTTVNVSSKRYRSVILSEDYAYHRNVEESRVPFVVGEFDDNFLSEPSDTDNTLVVFHTASQMYSCSFECSPTFYGSIIGPKGSNLQNLMKETGAKIIVPKKGASGNSIEIRAAEEKSVRKAKSCLEILVAQKRFSVKPTHFVALPLYMDPNFETSLKALLQDLNDAQPQCPGLCTKMIRSYNQLHLTLFVLHLHTASEVESANQIMAECKEKIHEAVQNKPLSPLFEGFEIMNDDCSRARVLYLKCHDDGRILELWQVLKEKFEAAGLLSPRESSRSLLLHCTLINTKYGEAHGRHGSHSHATFDAHTLLDDTSAIRDAIGSVHIPCVDILAMDQGADHSPTKEPWDGSYPLVARVDLP
eukprot:GCRY01003757.1.p1 GENE.GCRY01003757.1~~GCRY01003757.1.p1  ORF type:complete len:365 (+),score=33.15 GCRY01003757.1:143-1237(+)